MRAIDFARIVELLNDHDSGVAINHDGSVTCYGTIDFKYLSAKDKEFIIQNGGTFPDDNTVEFSAKAMES